MAALPRLACIHGGGVLCAYVRHRNTPSVAMTAGEKRTRSRKGQASLALTLTLTLYFDVART